MEKINSNSYYLYIDLGDDVKQYVGVISNCTDHDLMLGCNNMYMLKILQNENIISFIHEVIRIEKIKENEVELTSSVKVYNDYNVWIQLYDKTIEIPF